MSMFPDLDRQLAEMRQETRAAFRNLTQRMNTLMATMQDVQAAVTAEDTVVDSAIALLQGLAAAVAGLKPDQAAIDALAADITSKTQMLADAVTANTPAATR